LVPILRPSGFASPQQLRDGPPIGVGRYLQFRAHACTDPLAVRAVVQEQFDGLNAGGGAQGHERGKEYDTMSGMFADYIETEVLPRVEKNCAVKLTKDPDGCAAMGNSSGGSAVLIMAWYRTNLYHRVLTTSGTFVNQQWPFNPETPGSAWDFHETIIPNSPKKPLRVFISVGDRDLLNPNVMRDGMHDWVEANNRMAKVLKAKGYEYQYQFCRNAGYSIGNAQARH
jgi:hypothetical protein